MRDPQGKWVPAGTTFNEDLEVIIGPKGQVPLSATPGSAGYDLCAAETVNIAPMEQVTLKTDIYIKVPYGTYGRIAPRSSLAKKGLMVNAGVIDWDYRGEILILLVNLGKETITIQQGDRAAQLICEQIHKPAISQFSIKRLEAFQQETTRGVGGFGSTGK